MEHLDVATLLDGLEGRLSSDEQKALRNHIAGCEDCSEAFSGYATMLDALTKPVLQDAPEATVKKAFALFQAKETKPRSISAIVKSLLHDSWSGEAALGMRGDWDVRQVGMSTDNYDLHLSIDYAGANIRGQLLAKNEQGFIPEFQARLLNKSGTELDANSANEFGEFVLSNTESASLLALELNNGIFLQFEVPDGDEK
tara:strand:- start:136 stop:732 length:597 start_codon:yes stop_codon:yes gene_type:complete